MLVPLSLGNAFLTDETTFKTRELLVNNLNSFHCLDQLVRRPVGVPVKFLAIMHNYSDDTLDIFLHVLPPPSAVVIVRMRMVM